MIWFYPDQFKSRVWDRSNLLSRQIDLLFPLSCHSGFRVGCFFLRHLRDDLLDCDKTLEADVLHDSHDIFEASPF